MARDRDLGVQPGGQANVDQVHRRVSEQGVQIGGGGETELLTDARQLLRCPAEHDHLVDIVTAGIHGRVGLPETGAQQRDLHDGHSPRAIQAPQGASRPPR
jgi:hypothetical protein